MPSHFLSCCLICIINFCLLCSRLVHSQSIAMKLNGKNEEFPNLEIFPFTRNYFSEFLTGFLNVFGREAFDLEIIECPLERRTEWLRWQNGPSSHFLDNCFNLN